MYFLKGKEGPCSKIERQGYNIYSYVDATRLACIATSSYSPSIIHIAIKLLNLAFTF